MKKLLLSLFLTFVLNSCSEQAKKPNQATTEELPQQPLPFSQNPTIESKVVIEPFINSRFEYKESNGLHLMLTNSYPRGGLKYTAPNGKTCVYTLFFTKLYNRSKLPLAVHLQFPKDSLPLPSEPYNHVQLLLLADELQDEKITSKDYGIADVAASFDAALLKQVLIADTLATRDSLQFYVATLFKQGVDGTVRSSMNLEGAQLIYQVNELSQKVGKVQVLR